jgi:hypothetical protein
MAITDSFMISVFRAWHSTLIRAVHIIIICNVISVTHAHCTLMMMAGVSALPEETPHLPHLQIRPSDVSYSLDLARYCLQHIGCFQAAPREDKEVGRYGRQIWRCRSKVNVVLDRKRSQSSRLDEPTGKESLGDE